MPASNRVKCSVRAVFMPPRVGMEVPFYGYFFENHTIPITVYGLPVLFIIHSFFSYFYGCQ